MEAFLLRLLLPIGFALGMILFVWALVAFVRRGISSDASGTVSGAVAGMMTEIDRLTSPSAEHRTEAEEAPERSEDEIDGE